MESDRLYSTLENAVDHSVRENVYQLWRTQRCHPGNSPKPMAGMCACPLAIASSKPIPTLSYSPEDNPKPLAFRLLGKTTYTPINSPKTGSSKSATTSWDSGLAATASSSVKLPLDRSNLRGKLAVVLQGTLGKTKPSGKAAPLRAMLLSISISTDFFFIDMGLYSPNKKKGPHLETGRSRRQIFHHSPRVFSRQMTLSPSPIPPRTADKPMS